MSSLTINAHAPAALPAATMRPHHRGAAADAQLALSLAGVGQPGELPSGAAQNLFANIGQALQTAVGSSPAAIVGATLLNAVAAGAAALGGNVNTRA